MKIFLLLLVIVIFPCDGDLLILTSNAQHFSNCNECLRYPDGGSQHSNYTSYFFKKILVDSNHNYIFIGARNAVFRLDQITMKLRSKADFVKLVPQKSEIDQCMKRRTKDVCNNYITIMQSDIQGKIFTCGTYATRPKCWRFERNGTLQPFPPGGIDGSKKSPEDPQYNVVSLFTKASANEFLFTGLTNSLKDPGRVFKSAEKGSERLKWTVSDEEFINAPTNFASSFAAEDNYVYFLYGETAVEERSVVSVSRIARVCKFDSGGPFQRTTLTTFSKARLACTIPGVVPIEYSEIQGSFVDENSADVFVYATFSSQSLGAKGAAVCIYSLKNIQSVFKTSRYLKKISNDKYPGTNSWVVVSPPPNTTIIGRAKCDSNLDTKSIGVDTLRFANSHPLLSDIIRPVNNQPLFVKASVGFTHIIVDNVRISSGSIPVLLIGTDNGTIYKVFTSDAKKTPQVVEQIDVFKTQEAIFDMKLSKGALFVSSNSSIVKVPLQHCNRFKTCRSCVSAQDPYCGWSSGACVNWNNKRGSDWSQDIAFGNFSKVCPETPPSCTLISVTDKPGDVTVLQCNAEGNPLPVVKGWTKDSTPVDTASDYKVEKGETADTQKLLITNFGIQHFGRYQCLVSSKGAESSCTLTLTGSLPNITSGVKKIVGVSYFYCQAVAIPKAKIYIYKVINGKRLLTGSTRVPVGTDFGKRSYYCVASNVYGASVGETVIVEDRKIKSELKLTRETWSSNLQDGGSQAFKKLEDKILSALNNVYSENTAFIGAKILKFREGSVVTSLELEFAASPSVTDEALLFDLQRAVSSGNVSDLVVDENHPLTEELKTELATTVTQALTPTRSPSPTPSSVLTNPETDKVPTARPHVKGVGDPGLFAGVIVVVVIITLVLSFALGVLCHDRMMRYCRRSPDVESSGGKNVRAVKYQKSPKSHDQSFPKHPSKRKLLRKQENSKELQPNNDECIDDEYEDSDGSAAGKIAAMVDSDSEKHSGPEKTPVKNTDNANGKVLNIC